MEYEDNIDDRTEQEGAMDVEQEEAEDTNTLGKLLKLSHMVNICDYLDTTQITQIGRDVIRFTKVDEESRKPWMDRSKDAMDMALQVVEKKNTPFENASNIKYPILTVAALQFHARAYPAIVQGNKVVKGQITGLDQTGEKGIAAKNIADHMNYQLLEENESWETDVDGMLLALPIEGCEFKKSYFDRDLGYNVSEWVRPEDCIVNAKTKSLQSCPRITHRIWFYPHEIDQKQLSGLWSKDANLQISSDDSDEEKLQEFYEQHLFVDLDGDGYKEPYIATVHVKSQQVVRISAGFYPEEVVVKVNEMEATLGDIIKEGKATNQEPDVISETIKGAEFVKVPRINYFTKFSFFPSPDGEFYDIGFGQIVSPLANSIDTAINQLIDAGTYANSQSGFIRDGVKVDGKRGDVLMERGVFKRIQTPSSSSMADTVLQMKFNEPSLVLFQLLGAMITAAKDITGIQNIMVESQGNNEPATTAIARLEQGTKLFSAIYKRIYRSLKQEFKKLYKLNARYLTPQQYFTVLDTNEQGVVTLADYQNDGTNIQPVADPQLANSLLAMAKAQGLMPLRNDPAVNGDEVLKRYLDAMEMPNVDSIIIPADKRPQGDPSQTLKAMEAASKHAKTQAEIIGIYAKVVSDLATAESKEVGEQMKAYMGQLEGMISQWGTDGQAEQAGGVPMETPPSNGQGAGVAGEQSPGVGFSGV